MSLGRYIKTCYGNAVSAQTVFDVLKMIALSQKWWDIKRQELLDGITYSQIESYYEKNKAEYDICIDYMGYTFTATYKYNTEKYEAEQMRFAAYVDDLITATNKDEFVDKLKGHLLTEEKIKMAEERYGGVVEQLTDYEIALCENRASVALRGALCENIKEEDVSGELELWLFEYTVDYYGKRLARKPNDVKKITAIDVTENRYGTSTRCSNYSAYIYIEGLHQDRTLVRGVGHILFKSTAYDGLTSSEKLTGKVKELADRLFEKNKDNAEYYLTAYAMAGELLDMLFAEGKITEVTEGGKKYYKIDESVFEEYGLQYTGDSNVFYDGVAVGQMAEGFERWLFDNNRVEGEISYPEPIWTIYGYHIMYYRSSEVEVWIKEIRDLLAKEVYISYKEALLEKYQSE